MQKHHTSQLQLLVEELTDTGIVKIDNRQLYRIFGLERLGKTVWRQILERVSTELDEDENVTEQCLKVFEPAQRDCVYLIYDCDDWPIKLVAEKA